MKIRLEHCFWRLTKITLCLLVLGLTVRSLPYFAPIRARNLVQDDRAIEFRDRNGLTLGTLLTRDQDHTAVVPLEQISPTFIQAILAAEDGEFYRHGALELRAMVRSVKQAAEAGEIVSGASTITMQLARMLEPAPRTLPAKVREIWLAWRLSAGMNKDDILAAYINRLPMGGNIYGVEAAARIYFATPASELNLAQASLLAAIPNNPNYLNPYYYWQPLKRRQRYVLRRMVEDGYITPSQAKRAFTEQVGLRSRRQGIVAAPHFLFWVAKNLPPEHSSHIRTTIDRPLQQFVTTQIQQITSQLAAYNVNHGAALVIDNRSGEILAYVGSPDYFATFQGSNDGVQALRQPGSTLKPFLYQLALEKRLIKPNTVLADVPTHYAIPGARLYSPTDYSETFQGPVRIRVALANSLNIPAVRVLEKVGVGKFLHRLQQLGFQHLNQSPDHYGLGLALGSGEVSLWELARAYVTLARQGDAVPFSVTSEGDAETQRWGDGETERRGDGEMGRWGDGETGRWGDGETGRWGDGEMGRLGDKVDKGEKKHYPLPITHYPLPNTNPDTWALVIDMLSDSHARAKEFGVDSVLSLPFPTAVKTGTSSNFRDTWTVGFSRDYTVATWIGNFDGAPMQQVSGVRGAAPLWHRIMLHLHENREPGVLKPPEQMVLKPVCALSGKKPTPACPTVVQEYLFTQDLADYERNPDTFYQTTASADGSYRLNLPREYDEWLGKQKQATFFASELKILSPRQGDHFLLFPQQADAQNLEFKLTGTSESVEWWLNGKKVVNQSGNSWFWQMRPGEWTLEARSEEMRDKVTFRVELAENRPVRRGFSVIRDQ